MAARWSIQSPAAPGAVAVVQLAAGSGAELESVLSRLGIAPVGVGSLGLRDLFGVDRGVVARWAEESAHLMPHGGPAVVRALALALADAGIERAERPDARVVYPEARSPVEAEMLAALARAASPMAVDLLLDQPRRWATGERESEWSGVLNRLIDPPLVAAVGPPNVGKSSLANALAGRRVAIVADEPGTTRDHVGVAINMGGLVVRYVDTPGLRPEGDEIEREAAGLAAEVVRTADLVLACGDAGSPPARPPGSEREGQSLLTVALRVDLGEPGWRCDAGVSALTGRGLEALVRLIRERLVPEGALADPRPWRFWG
jgi:tRNA modification GTPase